MSAQPDEFDIEAALLRRSQNDLQAFMAALAVRLEGALPQQVTVERRRDGLLSKTSHVDRVEVRTDRAVYRLGLTKGLLTASKAKMVRGVVISTSSLSAAVWLGEVRAEVSALAEQAGAAADILHDFL